MAQSLLYHAGGRNARTLTGLRFHLEPRLWVLEIRTIRKSAFLGEMVVKSGFHFCLGSFFFTGRHRWECLDHWQVWLCTNGRLAELCVAWRVCRSPFHVVVGKPGFVGGKSHWFPEGFFPGEVGGLLRREGYSSSGERALLFLLKVTGISCESHVLSFLGSLCVCLLSTESIVPSLICDVVRSFLFHCRSWCSDFAAHSILVQDEMLQDTTAGQALRDSWRTAVPNARSLETPERLNEGFPNKNRGVYFVSMLFFV